MLWIFGGFGTVFFVVLLPMTVASALGSYLFFAQHSFKDMHILSTEAWTYYRAALESSSYMQLNKSCNGSPVTSVFTISTTSTFAYLSIACPR